ncbi:PAS domain-containing protein [Sporocytophaga myxococcoides]|uniref:PAS domain-containing protein n=1 Tax=Sporocytophaga myxococcoides TaxID=153721 RepID=UPI000422D0F7|nr:PAS domain-containing protein [Sporocytophaga myxococcoides]
MAEKKSIPVTDLTAIVLLRLGKTFCLLGTLIPILILIGRVVDYNLLVSLTPGKFIVMNPLSSICFILTGIAIWLVWDSNAPLKNKRISKTIVLVVSLIGLLKLLSLFIGVNLGLDVLLFKDQLNFHKEIYNTSWNEMAPNTALNMMLLGITIWRIDYDDSKVKYFQYINYFITLMALLSLYGYIYGVKNLYGVFHRVPMSFYSGLCFLLFSISVLFIRPMKGTMAILVGENPAEVVLLRFLAFVLPLIFGWLKIQGEKLELVEKELGTAVLAVLTYVISMLLIARKSSVQYRLRKARKKIVDLIEEDNKRLKRILDNSPTYISIYDLETGYVVYSNNTTSILGDREKFTAVPFDDLMKSIVHPEDLEKMVARVKGYSSFKEDEASQIDFRMIDKHGQVRWFYSRAIPFKIDNGKTKQIIINAMDFTNFKKAEQELQEQKKFIGKVVSASPNVIYIFDIKNRQNKFFSKNFFESLGYSKSKLNPLDINFLITLIYPKDLVRLQKHYLNFVNARSFEVRDIEYRVKDSKGNWRWVYARETAFARDEDGLVSQVVGVLQDITSRKSAEEALRYRELQLVEAQKIAHVGSYEWNLIKNEIVYTEEAYRIYGFPSDKKVFTIEDFKALLSNEDLIKHDINLSIALQESDSYEGEFRIYLPDKTQKTIQNKGRIERDSHDKPFRIFGTIMDITTHKRDQEKLRQKNEELFHAYVQLQSTQRELSIANQELKTKVVEQGAELSGSEERYRSFISNSSEGIYRYEFRDIDHVDTFLPADVQAKLILKHAYIAEANDMMAWMHGFDSAEELIGVGLTKFIILPESEKIEMIKNFILSSYRLSDVQTPEVDKNGKLNYYLSNISGVVKQGKLLRGWGTQNNVTQKVLTMEALKISEEKYRFLAENVPEIFWTADPDGTVDYHNKRWYEYTKSRKSGSLNMEWKSMVHPDDYSQVEKLWNESMQTGKEFNAQYRLKGAGQDYRWNLGKASPLRDNEGKIVKWIGTSVDIHEGKILAQTLSEKNEELTRINNDLDNFIYTASHDLKVPITNIEGLLYMLLEEMSEVCRSDKDVNEILLRMNISVNKFKKVITDLTEITRAQKSNEDEVVEINFSEILDEVLSLIRDLTDTTSTSILTDFSECSTIYFSERNLKSILYNLICNAIKFASPERTPEVKITTSCVHDMILLRVEDNGVGFDISQIDKAFSMFKKLHSHKEGSGIGLYIVKRIVTNAGGKIEVESERGKGSVFKVYFKKNAE